MIMIPLGFTTSTLLVYPIMITVYSKLGGKTPPLVSLIIHVSIIVVILSIYLNTLSFGSVNEVLDFLHSYRYVFPFPYVYITLMKTSYEPVSMISSLIYFVIGLLFSIIIPSRYGIKLVRQKYVEKGRAFILKYPKLLSIGLKDVLLLLRDSTRQKQFYGQLAALSTPFILTFLSQQIIVIIHGMEIFHALVIVSFYGILSYIMAIIATPILLFIESDRNQLLYSLPISKEDLVLSKTIASTILYQPIPLVLLLIASIAVSPLHGLTIYYVSNIYWIMGAYFSYKAMLSLLWGKLGAWTEFSLGVLKRITIMILLLLPLAIYLPILLLLYIYYTVIAFIIMSAVPLPITIYVLLKTLKE